MCIYTDIYEVFLYVTIFVYNMVNKFLVLSTLIHYCMIHFSFVLLLIWKLPLSEQPGFHHPFTYLFNFSIQTWQYQNC